MSPESSTFPGIYQKPTRRKRRSGLEWTVRVVLAVVLIAAGLLAAHLLTRPSTPSTSPSRQEVQAQAIGDAQKVTSGVVKVTCVMPTAWTPGDTFTCYGYGSSGRELAQMRGTVLPNDGTQWQMNEVWAAV